MVTSIMDVIDPYQYKNFYITVIDYLAKLNPNVDDPTMRKRLDSILLVKGGFKVSKQFLMLAKSMGVDVKSTTHFGSRSYLVNISGVFKWNRQRTLHYGGINPNHKIVESFCIDTIKSIVHRIDHSYASKNLHEDFIIDLDFLYDDFIPNSLQKKFVEPW